MPETQRKIYVDIETTGLDKQFHYITVIGALDPETDEIVQLVQTRNLYKRNVRELFRNKELVVTFNGSGFDLPFIMHHFPGCMMCPTHRDLMVLGWHLGLKGGQKKLEEKFNLRRNSGISNGRQATRLWKQYIKGDEYALEKLLEYNREDVSNLKKLEEELEKIESSLY